MRTYDVQITNMRIMKACFWRAANKGYHLTPPLKGFVTPTRNSQYVFSGADGGSVDEQFYDCATNTIELFHVGRARRKTGRMREMARKLPEPSRFVTSLGKLFTPTDVFIRLLPS